MVKKLAEKYEINPNTGSKYEAIFEVEKFSLKIIPKKLILIKMSDK